MQERNGMAESAKIRMTAKEYFELPETNQRMELLNGELIVYDDSQSLPNLPHYSFTR
jgi:hypothetical protein